MNKSSTSNHTKSLASHLSLWILSLGAIIFISVLSANYFLSRFLLEDYVADLARTTTASTVRNIESVFHTVSTNADSLASVISHSDASEKQVHQTIKAFLNTNSHIFGMTVALEPQTMIESLNNFSPYYYRKDDGITFSDLADNNYRYQNWPWYSEPKKIKCTGLVRTLPR